MTVTLERPVAIADDVLAPEDVRIRLARYIVREHPEFTVEFAAGLVVESARFQAASAAQPEVRMAPSLLVDIGWHAWLMHTVDRAALLERIGAVVHHVPELPGEETGDPVEIRRQTLAAMTAAGYPPRSEAWPAASGGCTQCHSGCTDSPNSGN